MLAGIVPLVCLWSQGMPHYPPPPELFVGSRGHLSTVRRPSILPPYSPPVPPRVPSTPTILTPVLPCAPLYPQYTVPSAAMHLPRLPPHHPPYRHVSPSTSTIRSAVLPCCPHHPSLHCRSRGPQAALLSPCAELGARGRLLTRTDPLSGPWAGPTPLRPYHALLAGRSPFNSLQRCRRCSSFSPSRRRSNPRSNPRNHPRDCRNRAASRDTGAMGIPYRVLGLITLVGTTHDTSP